MKPLVVEGNLKMRRMVKAMVADLAGRIDDG
jgi:hypothetical protein